MSYTLNIIGRTTLELMAKTIVLGEKYRLDPEARHAAELLMEQERREAVAYLASLQEQTPEPVTPETPSQPETETPPAPEPEQPQEPETPVSPPEQPVDQPVPAKETPQPPKKAPRKDAPPPPSIETVRAKGAAVAKKHGKEAVLAILQKYGVKCISRLQPEDMAGFLADLEGLGENA